MRLYDAEKKKLGFWWTVQRNIRFLHEKVQEPLNFITV